MPLAKLRPKPSTTSQQVLRANFTKELVIAVVGHVGSGTSTTCNLLAVVLQDAGYDVGEVATKDDDTQVFSHVLKASSVIEAWARDQSEALPPADRKDLERPTRLQDLGDQMRSGGDYAAVARAVIKEIIAKRDARRDREGRLDGQPRAYIIDSLRHPAEVHLLRHVYQGAFALLGVVCDEDRRVNRLHEKFNNAGTANARKFMERDRKAKEKWGQKVEDAFQLADFFVDNSQSRKKGKQAQRAQKNPEWALEDDLQRFVKIVTHDGINRPKPAETAMYAAEGAKLRSACLSRQVGAALVDRNGNLMATGTNEVPRAGGGVYGQAFDETKRNDSPDQRCAYRDVEKPFCSNTHEQNEIQDEIRTALKSFLAGLPITGIDMTSVLETQKDRLENALRNTRLGGLLEFSRAVHAEMDAVLSAARQGLSPVGARLFVTTFPCHVCARHIVAAGIAEVQYIEPYPKSLAFKLHDDSISTNFFDDEGGSSAPSKDDSRVLFRHFTGVAPRLYARAFLKDREYKDQKVGTMQIESPEWSTPWDIGSHSYLELEKILTKEG